MNTASSYRQLIATAILALVAFDLVGGNQYYITPLDGAGESQAISVSPAGAVAGRLGTTTTQAALWTSLDSTNTPTTIATEGEPNGSWTGITDTELGVITGKQSGTNTAWKYTMGTTMMLDNGAPKRGAVAQHINNLGRICGWIQTIDPNPLYPDRTIAAMWQTLTPNLLPKNSTLKSTLAFSINDANQTTGYGIRTNGPTVPMLWTGTATSKFLGTLGGITYNAGLSINYTGDIAGVSTDPSENAYPTWWPAGTTNALPWPNTTSYPYGQAKGINRHKTAVGMVTQDPYLTFGSHAAAFTTNNTTLLESCLINSNGWQLVEAVAINDLGQVVGNGTLYGRPYGFRLTPITAPTNLAPTIAVLAITTNGHNITIDATAYDPDGYITSLALRPRDNNNEAIQFTTSAHISFTCSDDIFDTLVIAAKDNQGEETTTPLEETLTVTEITRFDGNIYLALSTTQAVKLQFSSDNNLWLDCDATLDYYMQVSEGPGMQQFRLFPTTNTTPELVLYNTHLEKGELVCWASSTNNTLALWSPDTVNWQPWRTNTWIIPYPPAPSIPTTISWSNVKRRTYTFQGVPSSTNGVVAWFSTNLADWEPVATNASFVTVFTTSTNGFLKATLDPTLADHQTTAFLKLVRLVP